MALRGKMQLYAEARAQGLRPLDAAAASGYSGSGIKVTTSRLEARTDIRAEISRLKRGGKSERVEESEADETQLETWGFKDSYANPLELLLDVMNNPKAPKSLRYQAAKDAMPYCHARKEGGKKDEAKERSKEASKGRFATQQRPMLRSVA